MPRPCLRAVQGEEQDLKNVREMSASYRQALRMVGDVTGLMDSGKTADAEAMIIHELDPFLLENIYGPMNDAIRDGTSEVSDATEMLNDLALTKIYFTFNSKFT